MSIISGGRNNKKTLKWLADGFVYVQVSEENFFSRKRMFSVNNKIVDLKQQYS